MNKTLTISIAAYNVADYIEETLDSLVASQYIDDLEIFVVDDGGQDATLSIAQDYQKKYPTSIIPVHKTNGGYGTTVNYSLEHASGKYFKLLDGDDWVQTEALDQLVKQLKVIDTDLVVTSFLKGPSMPEMETQAYGDYLPPHQELLIAEVANPPILGMWAMCYKTSVLRAAGLKLPERLFYTDQLFCTLPIPFAKTIQYFDYPVYCYRLGRDGQSVSKESRLKNAQMTLDICQQLVTYISEYEDHPNYIYLQRRVASYYASALKTILLSPMSFETIARFKAYDQLIKSLSIKIYTSVLTEGKTGKIITLARVTNYIGLWLLKPIYRNGIKNWG
ncbi:glycosyltransferase family 2 protein [Streptococcus cuniculipharyngis]|uniref:Glycosyltransferase n=1 Tax=Streptococcus cuniculipharyngis TaxID=1562651 RepID=A0A5C5SDL1_9STRE|nr:glycosyltransferase family 2 protein [Streptococcus cuniculipharyngis]TWS97642.1 glycosyltransferase [Streptococcus cuniculipharyngis]